MSLICTSCGAEQCFVLLICVADTDLLIIDEAQILYKPSVQATALFNSMKALASGPGGGKPRNLRIILAVQYGADPSGLRLSQQSQHQMQSGITPQLARVQLQESHRLSLPDSPTLTPVTFSTQCLVTFVANTLVSGYSLQLPLTRLEYNELLASFRRRSSFIGDLPDDLLASLYDLTAGHVGGTAA